MSCHSGPLCFRIPNAHCSPDNHDLSLDMSLPQALQSACATPFNPLRISGNEPRDAVPAAWITSQNGAKREAPTLTGAALLRVPAGSGGWSARPGCPAKRRAEPSFPPHHQGAKEPVLGASPGCRQA